MNDNINENNTRYKATTNLNTAIENPQINVNNATDVNVQDLGYNNYVAQNNNTNDEFISNNYSTSTNNDMPETNLNQNIDSNLNDTNYISNNNYNISNNNSYSYEPTIEEKKVDNENFISHLLHSKEFKALIFILLILCLFLLLMPYIYDFIRELKLMK
ncbi:MAG: hypothetical protein IKF19_05745 [Bacilli bacterium]|nr:hypothetical protein [Bacilli bacterium]